VSNPPYIADGDPDLQPQVACFEPITALLSGESGLSDLTKIILQAPLFLKESGWLLVEHGYRQGRAVRELFQSAGFCQIRSCCDLAGHERVTLGCKAI
jgi:release factor glutamine methyltransferase